MLLFMLKKNIFLTGFMGSGKTSLGKILSGMLDVDVFDTDELITRLQGMSVAEIFSSYGESFFRDRESEVLELLGQKAPGTCVVSTGGGAVLREKNRAAIKKSGLVVYLDISAEEAYCRLKETEGRPLLKAENPLERIEQLLKERTPFYLQADICIDVNGKALQEIAAELVAKLAVHNPGKGFS